MAKEYLDATAEVKIEWKFKNKKIQIGGVAHLDDIHFFWIKGFEKNKETLAGTIDFFVIVKEWLKGINIKKLEKKFRK